MFALHDLKNLANQTSQLSQRRHAQSKNDLTIGIQFIEKFEKQGFKDSALLKEACRHLILALKTNQQDIRPHLGLIYLFNLIGDFETAQLYVASAQGIDPENPYLNLMQDFRHEELHGNGPENNLADDVDYAALHAHLLQSMNLLFDEMHQTPIPESTLDDAEIAKREDALQQFNQCLQNLQTELKILEQEEQIEAWYIKLHVLEKWASRQESFLRTTKEMREIHTLIAQNRAQVEAHNQQLITAKSPDELHVFEDYLEGYFDVCDRIADHLDALEAKKNPIDLIMPDYQKLLDAVEHFHEHIDEKTEHMMMTSSNVTG